MTRARRWWLATAVAAAVALAAYLSVALTYELEHGNTWSVGQDATFESNNRDVALHELRVGSKVQIAITVRNPGPLPIALDEVSIAPGADIAVDEVTMLEHAGDGRQRCCLPEDATAFHPITLGRGDQVMVWRVLRLTGANPYPPCAEVTLDSADIRYHVIGLSRSQQLHLRTKIAFRVPCQ